MMTEEKALTGFGGGIHCSMAVLGEVAGLIGMDEEEAKKLGSAFGDGMGHGGVCGCVTGAYMALGLRFGNWEEGQTEQMAILSEKKAEFERRFTEKFKSVICPEILGGLNPAKPEEKAVIVEKGLMKTTCAPAVCAAAEILKELLDA